MPRIYKRNEDASCITRRVTVVASGCWEWNGYRDKCGYGHVNFQGRRNRAHVVSFIAHGGELLPGQHVRHQCDNPPCCNPAHLIAGTRADNMRDMVERGRSARGSRLRHSILTEALVAEIRQLCASGLPQVDAARRFGVGSSAIHQIVRRKGWKHVGDGDGVMS